MTPTSPPREIDGARVVEAAEIEGLAASTEAAVRNVRGQVMPPVAKLALARYSDDGAVHLFYCDREWRPLNDTLHESIALAKEQAESEYPGSAGCWKQS